MRMTVRDDRGDDVEFDCADTLVSRWVCTDILRGKTYPFLPFVEDVRVVVDVGANCGAATVFFARRYPGAEVHAFEPASEPRQHLERNAEMLPNVRVHPVGLHSVDQVAPLYKGDGDLGMASIFRRSVNLDESESVQLRSAGGWAAERGIDQIDVLKVDVEGCEIEVLTSLERFLPAVKALYVEYDSREARREIARLLDPSHELYTGVMFLDQGECIYVRRDLAKLDAATERLRELFNAALAERSTQAAT